MTLEKLPCLNPRREKSGCLYLKYLSRLVFSVHLRLMHTSFTDCFLYKPQNTNTASPHTSGNHIFFINAQDKQLHKLNETVKSLTRYITAIMMFTCTYLQMYLCKRHISLLVNVAFYNVVGTISEHGQVIVTTSQ